MFRSACLASLVLPILCASLLSAEYKVGPSEKVTKISEIADKLTPGDVVELTGDITDSMVLKASGTAEKPIVIRGTGGRRKIDFAGARNGIETRGDYYVFEGLELTGAAFRGIFQVSHGIVIRDCYFHDNQNGIMGADDPNTGDITIEYCEFFHNGSGIYAHQMYLASWKPGAKAVVQFNYIHDSSGGLNIKSRMPHNVIRYNWIENAANYECDIVDSDEGPAGLRPMNTEFIGNVVVTGAAGNPHHKLNLGSDQPRSPGTEGVFTIANNTFIMRRASDENHVIRVGGNVAEARFYNNIFVAPGLKDFRVLVIEDTAAQSGEPGTPGRLKKLTGSGNFIAENAVSVPKEFTNTVRAADAGFTDIANLKVTLAKGSPCIGAGDKSAPMDAHYSPVRGMVFVVGARPSQPIKEYYRPGRGEMLDIRLLQRHSAAKIGRIDIGAFGQTIDSISDGPAAPPGVELNLK